MSTKVSCAGQYNFQVDIPEPSRGQVLVKVKACGLSLVDQKVCVL